MSLELRIIKDPCRQVFKPRTRSFGQHGGDIGRAPDSYWVLPDPKGYVSSRHCSVEFRDGSFWLRDKSRNGVFVNGSREPIGRGNAVPLQHGDRLRVAEYELLARVMDRADIADPDQILTVNGALLGGGAGMPGSAGTGEHPEFDPGHTSVFDTRALQGLADLAHGEAPEADSGEHATGLPVDVVFSTQPSLEGAGPESPREGGSVASRAKSYIASAFSRLDSAKESREVEFDGTSARVESTIRQATTNLAAMTHWNILPGVEDERAMRSYKILRTRVRRRMLAQQWRSLGVTGTAEGVGKTITALNLAITFARDSRSPAVIVDLDLYRPKIATYLGMEFGKGIADYLLGEATIDEILYAPGINGLIVVPNGRPLRDGSELLATPRMTALVKHLEALSPARTVIYDLPPLLMSDDVLVFSPHMDCVLDVVAVGVTPRASLQRSQEILSELNVVGVVLNRSTEQGHYGYYY